MGVGIVDQPLDIVLDATDRLVAGRDRGRDIAVAREQRGRQHRGKRARLAGDADRAGPLGRGAHVGLHESERHALDVVGAAEAVRPFDDHAVLVGDARQFLLVAQAFLARLGEAGRIDHHSAAALRAQAAHGIEHEVARDRQHRAVDPLGQLVDRMIDLEPEQFVAFRIDRIDVAGELVLHHVAQQRRAERAVAVRRANDRDGLGPQQAVDLRVGEAAGGHRISLRNFDVASSHLTQPRHPRESGDPGRVRAAATLGSRIRGNDESG